ncbi:MAG: hypothetical protein LKI80_15805 [Sporolactobacillus sp.]|jgi:hypothetical protein|nr:hypothetical protein [Sporolactobacillus sp.]
MFDLFFVEYGCLYMIGAEKKYDVKSNHYLILDPDQTHRALKPCTGETYFHWLHFSTKEDYHFSDSENMKNRFNDCRTAQPDVLKYTRVTLPEREIPDGILSSSKKMRTRQLQQWICHLSPYIKAHLPHLNCES